jgi:hypothetical protein
VGAHHPQGFYGGGSATESCAAGSTWCWTDMGGVDAGGRAGARSGGVSEFLDRGRPSAGERMRPRGGCEVPYARWCSRGRRPGRLPLLPSPREAGQPQRNQSPMMLEHRWLPSWLPFCVRLSAQKQHHGARPRLRGLQQQQAVVEVHHPHGR